MTIRLPYYSSKDYQVLAYLILPFTLIMNTVIFGLRYFGEWKLFLTATLITAASFAVFFTLCGYIAVSLKKRFPNEFQTGLKFGLMIGSFITITGLFLLLLFSGYEKITFLNYRFNEHGFVWAYVSMAIVNVFLTFLFEGIARYESWKASLQETEQLKKAYRQSQLQGLKSQVNPHFLFNSLNSLSSLISEDGDEAEKFLDEMSKVYRYMLRNDDEQLVSLQTELKFLESYLHLLKARYGDGLQVNIDVLEKDRSLYLPPLTLQVLVENAFVQNSISKSSPLVIDISSDQHGAISIRNNVQPRMVTESIEAESGLDNLVRKYELLNEARVIIRENNVERIIRVPLISKEKEAVV
jgi:two-component system, LytTR family, sensor kinase